jgi:hypothetical protein
MIGFRSKQTEIRMTLCQLQGGNGIRPTDPPGHACSNYRGVPKKNGRCRSSARLPHRDVAQNALMFTPRKYVIPA